MKFPKLSSLFSRSDQNTGWFAVCVNSRGVYFAHVKHTGSTPQVTTCAFHAAENVTPSELEKLRKDARIGNYQFITLLNPGEYQMLLVETPNIPVEEMKNAIRWRIKDSLDYLVEEATIDVLKIPAHAGGGERPQGLYAVAAHNSVIQKCIGLFEKAKIDLRVIDIPELAQRNVAALFEEGEDGLALLALDDDGGLLTFTRGGELYLARRIEVTLSQLQNADEDMRAQYFDRLELELERSMDYFARQYSAIPVRRLLVSAPEQLGMPQLLSRNLDIPVEQLELSKALDIGAAPDLADGEFSARMLQALGAALRQERRAL